MTTKCENENVLDFVELVVAAERVAKARGHDTELKVTEILTAIRDLLDAEQKRLHASDSSVIRDEIMVRVLGSGRGAELARQLRAIVAPQPREIRTDGVTKGDGCAVVGARARLALSSVVRVAKARGGAAWGPMWKAEATERLRQLVLKDLLADQPAARAQFWTSGEGKALYGLIHAPAAGLGFDDAVERLEELSPGWIDEQLDALGGNIKKADTAIGKIEAKAIEIQKSDPKLTIEQARAEAWRRNPDLYSQQKRERARTIREAT